MPTATPSGSPIYTGVNQTRWDSPGAVRAGGRIGLLGYLPEAATAIAFLLLFAQPVRLLVRDWWTLPESGHGLLLAPVAMWLAWRSRLRGGATPSRGWGIAILAAAVVLRYVSGLAAELFTMRASFVLALVGVTLYY